MAILNINWDGFDLERGLSILDQSLTAAERALEENRREIQAKLDAYEAAILAGEPEDVEYDDDVKIWDRGMAYENDLHMIIDAKGVMRKAHVIALYHLWERTVRSWTNAPKSADHDKLCQRVEKMGIAIHPRMSAIRDLNNVLKHNRDKAGVDLVRTSWPELFSYKFRAGIAARLEKVAADPERHRIDWYEAIQIGDDQMAEIVLALRTSGPVAGLNKAPTG
jgi:hypothetical protein